MSEPYKFKRLSQVDNTDSIVDEDSVMTIQNDEVKQIKKSNLFSEFKEKINELNTKLTDDIAKSIKELSDNMAIPDWLQNDETAKDFINNKPFYDSRNNVTKTITFDGNIEGMEVVYDGEIPAVKVSDVINPITKEDLIGCSVTLIYNGNEETAVLNENGIIEENNRIEVIGGYFIICNEDQILPNTEIFFKKGIYFVYVNETLYTKSLEYREHEGELKQLDDKYVSDNIARTNDIPEVAIPDWLQNDETAKDFIKNRPFYTTDLIETEMLNGTFTFITDDSTDGEFYVNDTTNSFLDPDNVAEYEKMRVVFDDVSYDTPIRYFTYSGDEFPYLGNSSIMSSFLAAIGADSEDIVDTGEPFAIINIFMCTNNTESEHNVKIYSYKREDIKIPYKYLDLNIRKGEGERSSVLGDYENNVASGKYSYAEGNSTTASGDYSHAEGHYTNASGLYSHAEGLSTKSSGKDSHSEGYYSNASGNASHAEGSGTIASKDSQHAQGKYNIEDTENKYAHVVGNGSYSKRSNAHTLDWDGNAWYAGDVEGKSMIVKSSTEGSTKRFKITVDDSGTISATEITE